MEAGSLFKPDIVINLGDAYDFNSVSTHRKSLRDAKNRQLLQEELAACAQARIDMERLGAKRHVFIEGNHEYRLDRYITDNAPMLTGLVDVRGLLGYNRGWEWVPYMQHIRIGKVFYTHDVGYAGASAVTRSQHAFESNAVIGHVHRIDLTVRGNAAGKPHIGAAFGWLGDPAQCTYMHAVKLNREWAWGFGLGYIEPDGTTHLVPVPIVNGKCVVEGKLLRG